MSINEITAKIEALQEWEALASEAAAQVESIKDELKEFMNKQGVEEYEAGTHIIRWTTVLSNRFDSTAFKKVMPDVYNSLIVFGRMPVLRARSACVHLSSPSRVDSKILIITSLLYGRFYHKEKYILVFC